ncbi:MAG: methylated-DNA--[protein]-cysteine S-methyltransferase [Burkholderiales bacterium]|nr:methylated-DNA--[protein]-cysteine S-methyltransferase [Burkholderiales bacterium]
MKTIPYAAQTRIETPLGPLTLAATPRGLALAWFDGQAHRSDAVDAPQRPDDAHLRLAAREFEAYWRDPARPFTVALDARGTSFQQAVWRALLAIDVGRLSTYGEIARRIGNPAAVRAVGAAIGRNPVSIIVPCHRVVGGDGSLTGYAGGLDRKRSLLEHEGALAAPLV